jgi:hypothetical protein
VTYKVYSYGSIFFFAFLATLASCVNDPEPVPVILQPPHISLESLKSMNFVKITFLGLNTYRTFDNHAGYADFTAYDDLTILGGDKDLTSVKANCLERCNF